MVAYPLLPAEIVIGWNSLGEVIQSASSLTVLLLFPALLIILTILFFNCTSNTSKTNEGCFHNHSDESLFLCTCDTARSHCFRIKVDR